MEIPILRRKGTDVFLNEDVSHATFEIRNSKMEELREKRRQGLIAYFSGTKIITKVRTRTTDNSDSPLHRAANPKAPNRSDFVSTTDCTAKCAT